MHFFCFVQPNEPNGLIFYVFFIHSCRACFLTFGEGGLARFEILGSWWLTKGASKGSWMACQLSLRKSRASSISEVWAFWLMRILPISSINVKFISPDRFFLSWVISCNRLG